MVAIQESDADAGLEDASDDEESQKGFIHASQVRPEHIEKMDKEVQSTLILVFLRSQRLLLQYLKQKKQQLAALGEWTHINCLRPSARENIQDALLRKLVYVAETNQAAKPQSQSRISALLDAVDLENIIQATAPPPPVETLPGGSVSFLFERTHKTALDSADDEDIDN